MAELCQIFKVSRNTIYNLVE
ncbi:hypothetical protein [Hyella patelloides]